MARTYSVKRLSRRWPLVFYILDIAGVNVFRIFEVQHPELNWHSIRNCRSIFLRHLADQLITPQMIMRSKSTLLKRETRFAMELCCVTVKRPLTENDNNGNKAFFNKIFIETSFCCFFPLFV